MIRKTAAITASSIAGIVLAGGAAVGANVGILNAASSSDLGQLSAEVSSADSAPGDDTSQLVPQTVVVSSDGSTATTQPTALSGTLTTDTTIGVDTTDSTIEQGEDQKFAIGTAGVVEVRSQGGVIKVTEVKANSGWTWQPGPDTPTSVKVTFTSSNKKFEFYASLNADGTIAARVDQPVIVTAPTPPPPPTTTPAPATATTYVDDDSYEDDDKYDDSDDDKSDDSNDDDEDDDEDDEDEGDDERD